VPSHRLPTLFVLTCLLVGCTRSPVAGTSADADAIRSLSNQWTDAIIAKDVDKILSLYAPDAVQLRANIPIMSGQEAIRAWYKSWLSDTTLTYTASTIAVDVAESRDFAYERGTYHISQNTPKGRVDEPGKYLTIWKKIDGEWKAVIDMSNPDNPFIAP
jgi:uncharacterized protein (TIGR02246 family)